MEARVNVLRTAREENARITGKPLEAPKKKPGEAAAP